MHQNPYLENLKKPTLFTFFWIFIIGYAPALLLRFALKPNSTFAMLGYFLRDNRSGSVFFDELIKYSVIFIGTFISWQMVSHLVTKENWNFESMIFKIAKNSYLGGIIAYSVFAISVFVLVPNFLADRPLISVAMLAFLFLTLSLIGNEYLNQTIKKCLSLFKNLSDKTINRIVWAICSVYFIWLYTLSVFFNNHNLDVTDSQDLSMYLSSLTNFASTGRMSNNIFEGANFMGEHFVPTLCLMAPLLKIWPKPAIILLFSSLLLAFSGVVLFRLAKLKTGSKGIGLCLVICLFLHPFMNVLGYVQFYELFLAPFFMFSMLYHIERGNKLWFWLCFLLLLGVKEDLALSTLFVGLYIIFYVKDYKTGAAVVILSAVYFAVVMAVIIPYYRGESGYLFLRHRYSDILGSGPYNFITLVKRIPGNFVFMLNFSLLNIEKAAYLIIAFIPVLFLAFRQTKGFIVLIPAALVSLLGSYGPLYHMDGHYTAYWVAPVFFTTILGIQTLRPEHRKFLLLMPLIAFLVNYQVGCLPPSINMNLNTDLLKTRYLTDIQAQKLINQVPENAVLDASINLISLSTIRNKGRVIPFVFNRDYSLIDLRPGGYSSNRENTKQVFIKEVKEGKCHVIDHFGYLALTTNKPVPNEKTTEFWQLINHRFETEKQSTNYFLYATTMELPDFNASGFFARRISPDFEETEHDGDAFAYGPYINLEPGAYKIIYRLKTSNNQLPDTMAAIDVSFFDQGKPNAANYQYIKCSDFGKPDQYQDFTLNFTTDRPVEKVEFRIFYKGKATLTADYTEVIKQ